MKVWALTDGPVSEGKYLVVRRDGTTPGWPHFVIAAVDPAAFDALMAYAKAARAAGFEEEYCASIRELAMSFVNFAQANREMADRADPDKGPHRKDLPDVIAMMRGKTDMRALVTRAETAEAALLGKEEEIRATAEVLKWADVASVSALASAYKTAQGNWDLALDRAEVAESRLQSQSSSISRLVKAARPFVRKAEQHEVGHSAGYDFRPHENNMVPVRLGDVRALSTAVAELGSGEGSAGANRDAAPISRPDSQHSDGGREP